MQGLPLTDATHYFASDVGQSADSDASVTLAAETGGRRVVDRIDCSYSGTPEDGLLRISDGVQDDWEVDFTNGGAGTFNSAGRPIYIGTEGQAVTVTHEAGGAAVVGKLNVHYR